MPNATVTNAMAERQKKSRSAPISYRPPVALEQEFHVRVEKSGLSVSGFITKAIFDQRPPRQSRRPVIERKLLARLLSEAAAIKDELQQIAIRDSDGSLELSLERAVDELAQIRAALLKNLGRKP